MHDEGEGKTLSVTQALWASAASKEDQLSSLLDAHGWDLEAAIHRVSAAHCYREAGDLGRAVNLFRAALCGPLPDATRQNVQAKLTECLQELSRSTNGNRKKRADRAALK